MCTLRVSPLSLPPVCSSRAELHRSITLRVCNQETSGCTDLTDTPHSKCKYKVLSSPLWGISNSQHVSDLKVHDWVGTVPHAQVREGVSSSG